MASAELSPETPLKELRLLAVDVQSTGASPRAGQLIELGWGSVGEPVQSSCAALEPDRRLPPRVAKMTGIQAEELREAPSLRELAVRFRSASQGRTLLAHYARFERPFVEDLLDQAGGGRRDWLCTHAISRRLLPALPRRTLRALLGYWGHRIGPLRRASPHVEATLILWGELRSLLAEQEGIRCWGELQSWLAEPQPPRPRRWTHLLPAERRLSLPQEPGVYHLLDRRGVLLYVGKAGKLRQRVNQHFRSRRRAEHLLEMITQVADLRTWTTPTSLEAALLESEHIQSLRPLYNRAGTNREAAVYARPEQLDALQELPDAQHCWGPMVERGCLSLLGQLQSWLRGEGPCPERLQALGPSDEARLLERCLRHLPDMDPSAEGLVQWGLRAADSPVEIGPREGWESLQLALETLAAVQLSAPWWLRLQSGWLAWDRGEGPRELALGSPEARSAPLPGPPAPTDSALLSDPSPRRLPRPPMDRAKLLLQFILQCLQREHKVWWRGRAEEGWRDLSAESSLQTLLSYRSLSEEA